MMGNQNFLAGPLSDPTRPHVPVGTAASRRSMNRGTDRVVLRSGKKRPSRLRGVLARFRGRN